MCLISFKLSTLWLSPAGGSSPAKVANTIEFHPEIRGTAFPPRPSCRIGPVSGGRDRRCSSRRRRRPRPAAPRTPPGGRVQPQSAAARCLGPEGAAGDGDGTRQVTWVASEDFGGFRRISEDLGGLKNWEFGFRLKHILVSATCLKSVSTKKNSLNWIGKSQLRTYNNLLNLQAYPFSGFCHICRLAPGSGGPPAASVGQLRRCLLLQPAGCLRLKTAETVDVW